MDRSEQFSEDDYRRLLQLAKQRYRFEPYGTTCADPHVLWRHDLDFSVGLALRLAEIEAEEGIRSTYFMLLRSDLYNLLDPETVRSARRIVALGHWAGLHFETQAYEDMASEAALAEQLGEECRLLESLLESPVEAFSFHDPDAGNDLRFDADEIAGLANAYGAKVRVDYEYVSDSNGYWRHRSLPELLESPEHERLHVLTHPIWWIGEPAPPRQRVLRMLQGRMDQALAAYDAVLRRAGRENIG